MAISVTELRPGVTVEIDGNIFRVLEYHHIKVAQQACVKSKLKNLRTGAIIDKSFKVSEKIERAHIERKNMQFLYKADDEYHFMEQETFEQIALSEKKLGDAAKYIKEGSTIAVMFYEDEVIDVDLPTSVELKVTETVPGIRGDTVSGGSKPATLETGLVVQVPLFIDIGEIIKVDTRTGEYIERA